MTSAVSVQFGALPFRRATPAQQRVETQQELIGILQKAYSGENAAAEAYQVCGRDMEDTGKRFAVLKIAQEELMHRNMIAPMLTTLGTAPSLFQESLMTKVGELLTKTVPFTAQPVLWFLSGIAEGYTVRQYHKAAEAAETLGLRAMADQLEEMVQMEIYHTGYFKNKTDATSRYARLQALDTQA